MLEAHPTEKSIIVNYSLEAAVYSDGVHPDPMLKDKKVSASNNNNNIHSFIDDDDFKAK